VISVSWKRELTKLNSWNLTKLNLWNQGDIIGNWWIWNVPIGLSYLSMHENLWVSVELNLGISRKSWKCRDLTRYDTFYRLIVYRKLEYSQIGFLCPASNGKLWAEMIIHSSIFSLKSAEYQCFPNRQHLLADTWFDPLRIQTYRKCEILGKMIIYISIWA
jgi:hypothetical protein